LTRAVLDPNVLVSAFIGRRGSAPDRLVRAWREGAFELIVSPKLLGELAEVLWRPKFRRQAGEGRAEAYVAAIAAGALRVDDPRDPARISPDVDDDYLVALAMTSRADVLVSGDRHLLGLESPRTPVVSPRELADRLDA